jgi:cation diffusion facilitator CzcD-associated flavoprotein CzcO
MTNTDPPKEPAVTTNSEYCELPGDSVFDVIVIGAGQSGLAIGWHLDRTGLRFLIVDGPEIGHVWRSRWDSLTLSPRPR